MLPEEGKAHHPPDETVMIPLCDMHCHLLAGMDDGPRTDQDAVAMCRIAFEDGTRFAAAGAHQNDQWKAVTPDGIRAAAKRLAGQLREANIQLTVFPCAEVMVHPEIVASWKKGELLSVADRGKYLLVEMPHNLFVDLRKIARDLHELGVHIILAHPERQPELLHDPGAIEELIGLGCLVQVSSGSITNPSSPNDSKAIKDWFKRGVVHLLGSDGHSPRRRAPRMADAYQQIVHWVGPSVADRVGSTNGMMVIQGLPLRVAPPEPKRTSWIPKLW
jgi:protein-tyrosine phosphatase